MNIERFRVFLQTIEYGSMLSASQELGYTPSGISYIIDTLEKELGIKLVSKTSTGIRLSHEGEQLLPYIKDMIDAADKVKKASKELSTASGGEITIGTFPSIGRLIMPDIIQAFYKEHPNVKINIIEGINNQLDQMLIRKEVDFNICSSKVRNNDFLPLIEDPMVCIVSKDSPLFRKRSVTREDICNQKFIMTAYGTDPDLIKLFEQLDFKPDVISVTLENSSAYAMVKRNIGITIVNKLATIDMGRGLAAKPFSPAQFIVEGITLPSYSKAEPLIKTFIDFTAAYVKAGKCSIIDSL
ncbi:MAG: LysR family transcriptional regulator [Clostridiales bacterium]|nr:LysR family transcriptional regulator [Clostridiales bacterium]